MRQPSSPTADAIDPNAPISPQLFRALRLRIMQGDLPPGKRLSEVDIATRHVTSRQPVREAFIKLSEAGLIDIRPQRGSFVSRIDMASVLAAQFVREAVEADIVRAAAHKATPESLAELDANLSLQEAALDDDDPRVFMTLDDAFHRMLADCAGQGAGWGFLETLRTQMDRVRHLSASSLSRATLVTQHSQILHAIKSGDPDKAEQQMRQHLRRVLKDIPVVAAANPTFFTPKDSPQ